MLTNVTMRLCAMTPAKLLRKNLLTFVIPKHDEIPLVFGVDGCWRAACETPSFLA